jgi:hypothetical protein
VGSTKADGTFRLEDVETGEVAVSARLRSMDMSERCGQLLANSSTVHVDTESEATLDIELTLPTSRIAGRVLRADGSAAEKASVSAWSREACLHASATTDSDGRFDMVVDDAAITFRVEAGEGVEQMAIDAVAPGTTNLEIKLGQRARLKLRVVDRDTRAPITQFHLVLQAAGRREQQFDTNMRMSAEPFALDPDGWCSLTIPADAYEVLVFDPPRVESGYQFASVPNVRVAANEETVVEVEREKGLEVVLQLAEGETAWSRKDTVVVFLQSRWWPDVDYGRNGMRWTFEVPRSEGRHIYFVNLDDVGRAAFKGLAPGTYRFKTGGVSLKIEPEQFVVPADGPVLLHLTRE